MKLHIPLLLSIIITAFDAGSLHANGNDAPPPTTNTIYVCQGIVDNCILNNASVGAAGDMVSFDTTGIDIKNYGRITKKTATMVQIPKNGKSLLTLTPTAGSQAERQVKILFYAFDLKNMPKNLSNPKIYTEATDAQTKYPWAKTMLKTYRQLDGEQQWTELIQSISEAPFDAIKAFNVTLFPDGTAVIPTPARTENGKIAPASELRFDLTKLF